MACTALLYALECHASGHFVDQKFEINKYEIFFNNLIKLLRDLQGIQLTNFEALKQGIYRRGKAV